MKKPFDALQNWFNTALGKRVAKAYATELSHVSNTFYGDALLQLGYTGESPWLDALHYTCQWKVSPNNVAPSSAVYSELTHLPFDKHSIDCMVLPLTLEAYANPHPLLAEMDRVLTPCGHVIFFSINPLSLWGAWLKWSKNRCFGETRGYPHSIFSLYNALLNHGFVQRYYNSFFYIPPVTSERMLASLEMFNEMGKMISPFPSAFYCLVLQKQTHAMWHVDPVLEDALHPVATGFSPV